MSCNDHRAEHYSRAGMRQLSGLTVDALVVLQKLSRREPNDSPGAQMDSSNTSRLSLRPNISKGTRPLDSSLRIGLEDVHGLLLSRNRHAKLANLTMFLFRVVDEAT